MPTWFFFCFKNLIFQNDNKSDYDEKDACCLTLE